MLIFIEVKEMIAIPNGVTVDINNGTITVKGAKGSVTKNFPKTLRIEQNGNSILITSTEKDSALVGTYKSLIQSMFKGVNEGYVKKLKALYAHFPMSFEVKGKEMLIKNFLGEKSSRKCKIIGDNTKVEIKGVQITISGPDIEAIGQTVANLKIALKIKEKDPRVFQDGVYEIIE